MTVDVQRMTWIPYEPEGNDYIPVERWGKDHWSTFAYLETRAVDQKGVIDNRRMRCNLRLHREFAFNVGFGAIDGSAYPTRLRDGQAEPHDDWSCLEDMVAAGLVHAEFHRSASKAFGGGEARVTLTPEGLQVAAALRAHKANGGSFGDFAP